jgi:hypothetical protein
VTSNARLADVVAELEAVGISCLVMGGHAGSVRLRASWSMAFVSLSDIQGKKKGEKAGEIADCKVQLTMSHFFVPFESKSMDGF